MRLRSLLLIPAATAALYACGDAEEAETPSGYEDVVYLGKVTDEALVAFASALDQKPPTSAPSQAATLDSPAEGAVLPRASAATFTWHMGATSRLGAPPGAPESGRWAGRDPSRFVTAAAEGHASPRIPFLGELVGPVRSARAHGDPFTGTATYLVFSVDANPKLVRVLTSETSYTPSKEAWDTMAAAGKPITLTLTTAIFEQNRVLQDGGPFAGSAITFTVAP